MKILERAHFRKADQNARTLLGMVFESARFDVAGALLTHFLAEPIFLSSVVVARDAQLGFDGEALRRAVYGRLEGSVAAAAPPYALQRVSTSSVRPQNGDHTGPRK